MKNSITVLAFLSLFTLAFAQNPSIEWQKTIGGDKEDQVLEINPTSDGGYILGGKSLSNISGDKTQEAKGGWDIWIVKINSNGIIEWDKTIGGDKSDVLGNIFQTSDGGYFISAESSSGISGDKTANSKGYYDYWILKLDALGNIIWQHTYGGDSDEYSVKSIPTDDGGYLVCGGSLSDISGDKAEDSKGYVDIWLLKLDENGLISWQKTIGGNLDDTPQVVKQTSEGGFIISSLSNSPSSSDKSQGSFGQDDFWVIKLFSDGSIEWDKTLGGSGGDYPSELIQTSDGGYLVGGYSDSQTSGTKTENAIGKFDYWISKLNNNGTLEWDSTIGGTEDDFLSDLKEYSDGSILISGNSSSSITGDKTDPLIGYEDIWFVKIDSSGTVIGQQTIGGDKNDFDAEVTITQDGGFVVGASSNSNIYGDKTEDSKGTYDYWVFKMESSALDLRNNQFSVFSSIFPNPTQNTFNIDLGKDFENVSIEISDVLGKVISKTEYNSAKKITQEINAPSGIYFVKIAIDYEELGTYRMIKK